MQTPFFRRAVLAATLALLGLSAGAQEATIRKNLAKRMPKLPAIESVSRTVLPGIYEVRIDNLVLYTNASGRYLLQGELIDIQKGRNLTEERTQKLNAVAFSALPLKDALTTVQGTGKRKIAVFADPNCGYCKTIEKDLKKLKNVTVYTFLYPVLSQDSIDKSRNIWCSRERNAAWDNWMLKGQAAAPAAAMCDSSAISRNSAFGQKHRITSTPTLIFSDNSRVSGALNAEQIEQKMGSAALAR